MVSKSAAAVAYLSLHSALLLPSPQGVTLVYNYANSAAAVRAALPY